ncbi:MAG: hypothetical protein IPL51_10185 [Candidatus Competibacteraceae bacterium]|nr:hypothetical protein [Candidatus Competibacteraceae bacterium]
MATIDLTTQEAPWAYPARPGGGPSYSIAKLVDFSEVNEKAGMGAADIIKLVKIPANTIVQAVAYRVFKASANLASLDIGDSAGPTQYATALDMTSIKDGVSALTGKFYTQADFIQLRQNTAATVLTGVIEVVALCWDANAYKGLAA